MQRAFAILSSVACPTLQHFSTFSHKRYDFRKKKFTENKMSVLFSLQLLSEIFLILTRVGRDIIKNEYWYSCIVPVSLVRCHWNLYFFDRFSKNAQISNFVNIRSVVAELFRSYGRRGMTKLIVTCSSSVIAPDSTVEWLSGAVVELLAKLSTVNTFCEIRGYHSGVADGSDLLGCDSVSSSE